METLETTLVVTGYEIHIEPFDGVLSDHYISVLARIETSNGHDLGTVETDVDDFARNLPLALAKVYFLTRKIDSGKIVPNVEF